MKIVIDTNVIVSALLKPRKQISGETAVLPKGAPALVLDLALLGKITPVLSFDILTEYHTVLGRRKLGIDPHIVSFAMEGLKSNALLVSTVPWEIGLRDPDDAIFLEAARAAFADVLVSGNIKHFPKEDCEGIRVLSPAEFLAHFDFKR